jgi:hypothetical protein
MKKVIAFGNKKLFIKRVEYQAMSIVGAVAGLMCN